MASRWFVFWMALYVVDSVKGDWGFALLWLIFAALTTTPKGDEVIK